MIFLWWQSWIVNSYYFSVTWSLLKTFQTPNLTFDQKYTFTTTLYVKYHILEFFYDKSLIHVFLIDSFMNQLNWFMEINKTSNSNVFCYWRFNLEMLLMHLWSCSHTQELWQWHVSKFVLMILSFRNLSDQWKAFPQGFFYFFIVS